MAGTQLNLQRNTKVFYSVEDLSLSATAATDLTPQNTWRIEVLAGYALSADSAGARYHFIRKWIRPR